MSRRSTQEVSRPWISKSFWETCWHSAMLPREPWQRVCQTRGQSDGVAGTRLSGSFAPLDWLATLGQPDRQETLKKKKVH